MKRNITAIIALIILCLPALAFAEPVHDVVLQGTVDFSNVGDYLMLPFDVPAGTTKIYFSYSKQVQTGATYPAVEMDKGLLPSNTLDIGVYDPDGFRGWSGSNKSSFTISESRDHTSDSYIPGALQAGTWNVELGVGWVENGDTLAYTVNIDFSTEAVGTPFVAGDPVFPTLINQADWYKGDLHCHSTHSDGSTSMAEVMDYAYSRGLDFIALTDHNAVSHQLYIPENQANYSDMLLIYGVELTAYNGHANVFSAPGYVNYHGSDPNFDINAVADEIHSRGGYISPNHPFAPNIPVNGHLHGLGWFPENPDYSKYDFWEAVNGPMIIYGVVPNPGNIGNIEWWDRLQNQGYGLTIRGGSDDHRGGTGSGDTYAPIGMPTTVVYAENLSEEAIMEGIAAGHCFISTQGPDGTELYLGATDGVSEAIMGDTLYAYQPEILIQVVNGDGMKLSIVQEGRPMPDRKDIDIISNDFSYSFNMSSEGGTRIRAEVRDGIYLMAITNSLYLEPDPGDDDDIIDDDDSAGGDDDDDDSCGC